jgi:hypothetical protein
VILRVSMFNRASEFDVKSNVDKKAVLNRMGYIFDKSSLYFNFIK